ncbi:MAG: MATE family efflux transporter [Clostridia bacterium]|nr:MATE family efflux transporter [Clostridia bacterium]
MSRIPLVRDKEFYRRFFSIWAVLVLHNVITLGVNLADNVMIGAYSETAMAGVSAVNQIQFVFYQLLLGMGDAIVVLGSQYWGGKQPKAIKRFFPGALLLSGGISLLLFAAGCFFPETMVRIFTDDEEILAAGVEYLRIMKWSYLFFALTSVFLSLLRSVETVRIGFIVSLSTLLVNVSLNYLLIEGHFGFPAWGVTGAAVATLAARVVELVIVMVYLLAFDRKLRWRPADAVRANGTLVRDFVKLSGPFLLTSLMFGVATALQTAILGHMDDSAIAANSVASTLYQTVKVAIVGAASAAAILIGTAIGSGRMDRIKSYAKTLQLMFLGIGVCTSGILFALRLPILSLYKLTPDTYKMASDFILVLCVTGFGTAYQMPTNVGIIRGGGDAEFVMKDDLISIWGIVIPLSFLAAFVFKWPPIVVISCLNADQVFKCIPACIHVHRWTWMKKLTRKEAADT